MMPLLMRADAVAAAPVRAAMPLPLATPPCRHYAALRFLRCYFRRYYADTMMPVYLPPPLSAAVEVMPLYIHTL